MRLPAFTDLAVAALGLDSKPFLLYYRVDFAFAAAKRLLERLPRKWRELPEIKNLEQGLVEH